MDTVLPRHIQEAADAADALVQQLNAPADVKPVPSQPTPPAPVEPTPAPTPVPEVAALEQKLRTLQGKYDAEVPQLHTHARQLQDQLASTTQALLQSTQALTEAKKAPPEPETPAVTGAEEEAFGKDLIDVVTRVATAAANKAATGVMQSMDQKFVDLEARLTDQHTKTTKRVEAVVEQQTMTAEQAYFAGVAESIPKYKDMLNSPHWLEWIGQVEPLTGVTRQLMLDAAFNAFDVPRTVAILDTYPQIQAYKVAGAQPARSNGQAELQLQEAPSGSHAIEPTAPEGRIWTGTEYNAVFDPRYPQQSGYSREQVTALQADADRAQVENRVDWSR